MESEVDSIVSGLPRLDFLDLSNNEQEEINSDMWLGIQTLIFLSLSFNKISLLHAGAFSTLPNLQRLILSINHIDTILPAPSLAHCQRVV